MVWRGIARTCSGKRRCGYSFGVVRLQSEQRGRPQGAARAPGAFGASAERRAGAVGLALGDPD